MKDKLIKRTYVHFYDMNGVPTIVNFRSNKSMEDFIEKYKGKIIEITDKMPINKNISNSDVVKILESVDGKTVYNTYNEHKIY